MIPALYRLMKTNMDHSGYCDSGGNERVESLAMYVDMGK